MFDLPVRLSDVEHEDDGSVWEAIKTCESILEQSPEDEVALSALAASYERVGENVRARQLYLQLAEICEREELWQELFEITEHVLALNPVDQVARKLGDKARARLGGDSGDPEGAGARSAPQVRPKLAFDLNGELELAWLLLQNELVSQEQYENAIAGLTESRMNPNSEATLALLQELAEMERVNLKKIVGFLAAHTETPFVEIHQFEIGDELINLVPLADARRLGVLPFAEMSGDLMVALLNPVDENLRQRLQRYLRRQLHFFLTSPESFQEAMGKIDNHAAVAAAPTAV